MRWLEWNFFKELYTLSLACTVVQSKVVRIGSLVKGKPQYLPLHHAKTLEPILMKFGRIDYVFKFYKCAKFDGDRITHAPPT